MIHGATLKTEAAGSFNAEDGLAAGASIPSHLRMGISHDPSIPCPSPTGCSIDLDNIQVIDAGESTPVEPRKNRRNAGDAPGQVELPTGGNTPRRRRWE